MDRTLLKIQKNNENFELNLNLKKEKQQQEVHDFLRVCAAELLRPMAAHDGPDPHQDTLHTLDTVYSHSH